MLVEMRTRFGRSNDPTVARYLVNAGPLRADSWYRDTEAEGSRFVGEGGHFIDTMSWWIGADPVEVIADGRGRARRHAGDLALRRRLAGDHHLPDQRARTLSEGDLRGLERRADGPPRQLQASHGVGRTSRDVQAAPGAPPTRASAARSRRSSMPCAAADPMPISLGSLAGHHPRHPRLPPPAHELDAPAVSRWGSAPGALGRALDRELVELEWYLRRLSKMSASEVGWRVSDHVRAQAVGARHQVAPRSRPIARTTAPGHAHAAPWCSAPDAPLPRRPRRRGAAAPSRQRRVDASWRRRTRSSPGSFEVLGCVRKDMEDPDWFFDPVTGRRAPQGDYCFKIDIRSEDGHRQREAGVGAVAPAPPDGARRRLRLHR